MRDGLESMQKDIHLWLNFYNNEGHKVEDIASEKPQC